MKKNYKLQNTKYKQNTNYNFQNYKSIVEDDQALNQLIINPKGGHGLPKGSLRLQTMTAFNKKFLRGSRGQFFQKAPPGRRRQKIKDKP